MAGCAMTTLHLFSAPAVFEVSTIEAQPGSIRREATATEERKGAVFMRISLVANAIWRSP